MTVARQEMERDNLDYTSLEIIITSFLTVLFTEKKLPMPYLTHF